MPKVDITNTSGKSKMPEFKKAPSKKPEFISRMPNLNASALHHNGDKKVIVTETTKTVESEDSIEVEKNIIIEEIPDEAENTPTQITDFNESGSDEEKNEPELIDNLDNFEEKEEKENTEEKNEEEFDMEIKEKKMPKKTKKEKKKLGKRFKIICSAVFLLFALAGISLLSILFSIGFLPEIYLFTLAAVLAFFLVLFGVFTFSKKFRKVAKSITIFFEVCFIVLFCLAFAYVDKTTGFVSGLIAKDYQIEEYYIIVKTDSDFEKTEDLNSHTIATYTDSMSENYQKALDEFAKKTTAEQKTYDDFSDASFAFLKGEANALFLKGSLKSTAEEIVSNYNTQNPDTKVLAFSNENVKIIDTIEIKVTVERKNSNADLSTEPFNVFISGIDTYGDISIVSRSDVNMIATVNPRTHQILLTSIPRDYYVQLHGTTGLKDKLTHAGLYGVDKSRETLEDLFDIKIDHYVRVNFSSVEKIVDAIGGITINSEYELSLTPNKPGGEYCYYSIGENYVDGYCALRFARERHSYADGDNQRIKNQQEVLDAVIKKVSSSKTIISNYSELLSALSGNVETDISSNQIYKLVQAQLREMPSWKVDRITVDGEATYDYTYSIPSQLLYVAIPDESSVETARQKINEVLNAN